MQLTFWYHQQKLMGHPGSPCLQLGSFRMCPKYQWTSYMVCSPTSVPSAPSRPRQALTWGGTLKGFTRGPGTSQSRQSQKMTKWRRLQRSAQSSWAAGNSWSRCSIPCRRMMMNITDENRDYVMVNNMFITFWGQISMEMRLLIFWLFLALQVKQLFGSERNSP